MAAYGNPRQPTAPESCPYRRKRLQDPKLSEAIPRLSEVTAPEIAGSEFIRGYGARDCRIEKATAPEIAGLRVDLPHARRQEGSADYL